MLRWKLSHDYFLPPDSYNKQNRWIEPLIHYIESWLIYIQFVRKINCKELNLPFSLNLINYRERKYKLSPICSIFYLRTPKMEVLSVNVSIILPFHYSIYTLRTESCRSEILKFVMIRETGIHGRGSVTKCQLYRHITAKPYLARIIVYLFYLLYFI